MISEHKTFLKEAKKILKDVVSTKNFEEGFNFINDLQEKGKSFARSISIMLDGMEKAWVPSEHEGETFLEVSVRKTGLHPTTIIRHSKIQRLLESGIVPEEHYESIEQAGEKSLIQVANTVERGFELTNKDWLKLAEASGDDRKVGQIVRKIKGEAPRSNFYMITINKHGVLFGHSSSERKEIGRLSVNTGDPFIQKGVDRLTSCSGVQESVEY